MITGDTRGLGDICRDYREQVFQERDRSAVLRGTVGRLEDTIKKLLDYTQCGCGEDEEGHYSQCVPCQINDEWIYS